MAGPTRPQLVFVDGSVPELIQELADYMEIGDEVKAILDKEQQEEALARVVRASAFLNTVPEKDFAPAYNLLIHLVVNESKDPKKYLPTICQNLLKAIPSTTGNGPGLALNALQTMFNLVDPADNLRYHVFLQILRFVKTHTMYDNLKPALPNIQRWLQTWDVDEDDQRKVFLEVSELAKDAGEEE